jgi:hypothetical protein
MKFSQADIDRWITVLSDTCGLLTQLGSSLEKGSKEPSPSGKEWSPSQILAHLQACQEIWGYSIYAMLIGDDPELQYFHLRDWVRARRYQQAGYEDLLRSFTQARKDLLRTLQSLKAEDWLKSGRIEGRVHTVYSQARRMAKHELEHADQLGAFLE